MTKYIELETSKLVFYISFLVSVLSLLLLFLNSFIGMGEAISYVFILLVINAPILFGVSIYRIVKKDYVLPIIAILISMVSIVLFVLLLYALASFT